MKKFFFTTTIFAFLSGVNNSYSQTQYLVPGWDFSNYSLTKVGPSTSAYGGFLLHKNGLPDYGDGDDFAILTYGNRDLTLRAPGADIFLSPNGESNVGIGTTSPISALSIYSTGSDWNTGLRLSRSDGGDAWIIADFQGMKFRTINDGDDFYFRDNSNNTSMIIKDGGKVGVGITSPSQKLHVGTGNIQIDKGYGIYLGGSGSTTNTRVYTKSSDDRLFIRAENTDEVAQFASYGLYLPKNVTVGLYVGGGIQLGYAGSARNIDFKYEGWITSGGAQAMYFKNNGYVGVGNSNPVEQFQIGDLWSFHNGGSKVIGYNYHRNGTTDERIGSGFVSTMSQDASGNVTFRTAPTGAAGSAINATDWVDALTILNDGTVAVGQPQWEEFSNYKMVVDGKFGAREIKVQLGTWADYVFEDDYELRSLEEVSEYIVTEGHLPDVPSTEEVTEDGVNLGEMDAVLLRKIEELTLYILEQEKRIQQLEAEAK